jgi:hypothetical protein
MSNKIDHSNQYEGGKEQKTPQKLYESGKKNEEKPLTPEE